MRGIDNGWVYCDGACGLAVQDVGQPQDWVCEGCALRAVIAAREAEKRQRALVAAQKEALTDTRRAEWLQVYCAAVTGYTTLHDTPCETDANRWAAGLADRALEAADEKFPLKEQPEDSHAV